MAHSYSIIKSFVDTSRANLLTGYVQITFADNYSSTNKFPITATDINPNLKTLYVLIPVGGMGGHTLEWDYDNQRLTCWYGDYSASSDGVLAEAPDAYAGMDNKVVTFYYEGA